MLEQLAERITARKQDVLTFKMELTERLDAHMRDSALLKAWIEDSLQLYADELETIVNGKPPEPTPHIATVQEEAKNDDADIA